MLYLHFCSFCQRIHILSGHRKQCPACDTLLRELSLPYEVYIHYSLRERERFKQQLHSENSKDFTPHS